MHWALFYYRVQQHCSCMSDILNADLPISAPEALNIP